MNHSIIIYMLGWIMNIEAALMLIPILTAVVYKEGIKDYNTGIALTQQEISELVEQYEKYKLTHTDVVAWAWLD